MDHDEEVAFIMGEVAERAVHPLPLARDLRRLTLQVLDEGDRITDLELPAPAGRLSRLRQVVVDVVGPAIERQSSLNRGVMTALRNLEALSTVLEERYKRGWVNVDLRAGALLHAVEDLRDRVGRDETLAGVVASLQVSLVEHAEALVGLHSENEGLRSEVAALRSRADEDRLHVRVLIDLLQRRAESAAGPVEVDVRGEQARELDELYAQLEDRFRRSDDVIRNLRRDHLALIADAALPSGSVVDVGAGRGDWLELLRDAGVEAYGVDVSAEASNAAAARGVEVVQSDAVEHLAKLDEGSLRAVTGFHLIEHLTLVDQVALVRAASRALAPGGLLLLETPNPTNLIVGSASFFLDPSHVRPMHPQLLEFLVRMQGLDEVEIRFLHAPDEQPGPAQLADPVLDAAVRWALFGPQDYAVVARKPAPSGG